MSIFERTILACIVVATILFLRPMMGLGFISDDALNSYINGWIAWHHLSFWSFYVSVVKLWIASAGRFMPLNLGSVYVLFHLTQNAFAVKAVQVTLVALNVLTLAALARRLAGTWTFGLLVAGCVALTLQIRFPLDPIVGFTPLLPLTMELVLLALWLQLEWQRTSKWGYLLAAASAFTAATLAYEITDLYLIIYCYLAWRRQSDRRRALFECAAFAAPIVVLVGLDLALRQWAHIGSSNTYALALAPGRYLHTYLIQVVAAVPLTFTFFQPEHVRGFFESVGFRPLVGCVIAFVFGGLTFLVLRQNGREVAAAVSRRNDVDIAVVGGCLWLLAAPMIAASPLWQQDLVFGQAYLPVYFEFFGVALLVAVISHALVQAVQRPAVRALVAAVLGILSALTYQTNRPALAGYQPIFTQGRFALEEAVRDGLFSDVPDGATIVLDHSYVWDLEAPEPIPNSNSRYLLYMLLGKRLTVDSIDDAAKLLCPTIATTRQCDLQARNVFAYFSGNPSLAIGDRWTRLAKVDGVTTNAAGVAVLTSTTAQVEARGVPAAHLGSGSVAARLTSLRHVNDTVLANAKTCLAAPANAIPAGEPVFYGLGFYGQEHNPRESFLWSQQRSSLQILAGPATTRTSLSLAISSFVKGTRVRVIVTGQPARTVPATAAGTPLKIAATIRPGKTLTVAFVHEGPPFLAPGDPRDLAFRVVDLHIDQACTPLISTRTTLPVR